MQPPAIEALPESGMGLHIMQSFMDMSYRAGRPNLLKLNKRLAAHGAPRSHRREIEVTVAGGTEDSGRAGGERNAGARPL